MSCFLYRPAANSCVIPIPSYFFLPQRRRRISFFRPTNFNVTFQVIPKTKNVQSPPDVYRYHCKVTKAKQKKDKNKSRLFKSTKTLSERDSNPFIADVLFLFSALCFERLPYPPRICTFDVSCRWHVRRIQSSLQNQWDSLERIVKPDRRESLCSDVMSSNFQSVPVVWSFVFQEEKEDSNSVLRNSGGRGWRISFA